MSLYENCTVVESHAFALPSINAPSGGGEVVAYLSPFKRFDNTDPAFTFAVSPRSSPFT